MNILPVSYTKVCNTNSVQYNKKLNEISFGIKNASDKTSKPDRSLRVPFIDFVEDSATKHNHALKIPAENYLKDIENIAKAFSDIGITFDLEYCKPNAIKSGKTVASKILRSKTFVIPDRIRATLYNKNIYDMDILFNKILPEFEKLGYVIAYIEMPLEDILKRGYNPSKKDIEKGCVLYPDIDVRLNKKYIENVEAIPKQYKYSLGEPQESGYEDIQIRFTKRDGYSNPIALRELIILTGAEYAKTKHFESENIYSYTRQFQELNILNSRNKDESIGLLNQYIKNIKDKFSNEITKNLYSNAMSYDRFGIKDSMSISIHDEDERNLTENYNNIEKITRKYYKKMLELAANPEEYRSISVQKNADLERLAIIRRGLTKAVSIYK